MSYKVFREFYSSDLEEKVNAWCKLGYRPHGTIVVESYGQSVHYLQVMIKEDDE